MTTSSPLILSPDLLIARGTERDCYRHPLDANLCIKVNSGRILANKKPKSKQSLNEFRYYKRFHKRAHRWTAIPTCHGWAETNLGPGLVFDLIRNDDGQVSKPFLAELDNGQITVEQALTLLKELKAFMLREQVIPNDMHPDNILLQWHDGSPHLKLIDGIGSRDFVKLAERTRFLGSLKIERNWERLAARLARLRPEHFQNLDIS